MDDLGGNLLIEKKRPKIPIYIVEDHHEVMRRVHQSIRKKYLPISGVCLFHFDSHPDMLIPIKMPADNAFDTEELYDAIDIENWILPNCYNGIFRHLVWAKPPWSNQIKNDQLIHIGKCKETGTIRCDSKEIYFIADGLYRPLQDLDNVKTFSLELVTVGHQELFTEHEIESIRELPFMDGRAMVLDIDLDFFGCQNPFLGLYKQADMYERVKKYFKFIPPASNSYEDILEAQNNRHRLFDELETYFNHLDQTLEMPDLGDREPSPNYLAVKEISDAIKQFYSHDDIDFKSVFAACCTVDDHELPDYIPLEKELNILFQNFETVLDTFEQPPILITISRSSEDEYTPKQVVDHIQNRVLEILNRKFDCFPPELDYEDQSMLAALPPLVIPEPNQESENGSSVSDLTTDDGAQKFDGLLCEQ